MSASNNVRQSQAAASGNASWLSTSVAHRGLQFAVAFDTVRVAAVQATPVILDVEATIDKVIVLLNDAADRGATLVVFPECFVSLYPSGAWAAKAATWSDAADALWERMWASSIDVDGPQVGRLAKACGERGVHVAIGVNEREDHRPGSLYNTLLIIGAEGLASPPPQADADDARACVPRGRRR